MKIVIAMDSLKGSLTSLEAGCAAAEGIRRVFDDAQILIRPIADGGEGTAAALTYGRDAVNETVPVTGPLGQPIEVTYSRFPETGTAVLEMAAAAGLPLVPTHQRDPLKTTTYGVGELIRDAIHKGCRRFILGLGGSATNDGGVGMLTALGYDFLDRDSRPIGPGALGLSHLHAISAEHVLPQLKECQFLAACDVTNPLCGSQGCSVVFGPQKGADAVMAASMDQWMARYASLAKALYPQADPEAPGSGAAGGMGFALCAFLGASLRPGIQMILEETGLEAAIRQADVVITGEGRMDGQTAMGKAPAGIAQAAKRYGKPVLALVGSVSCDVSSRCQLGIDAVFPILRSPITLEEAMEPARAKANMADTAQQVFRLWSICQAAD